MEDMLGRPKRHQDHALFTQIEALLNHIRTYRSMYVDLRPQVRLLERLLEEYTGFLIGNQCQDFVTKDGVTEMEENVMANAVERNLNVFGMSEISL